jgi:hypothetical protein
MPENILFRGSKLSMLSSFCVVNLPRKVRILPGPPHESPVRRAKRLLAVAFPHSSAAAPAMPVSVDARPLEVDGHLLTIQTDARALLA